MTLHLDLLEEVSPSAREIHREIPMEIHGNPKGNPSTKTKPWANVDFMKNKREAYGAPCLEHFTQPHEPQQLFLTRWSGHPSFIGFISQQWPCL